MPEKQQTKSTSCAGQENLVLQHEPALIMPHVTADQCREKAARLRQAGFKLHWSRQGMIMQKITDSFDISFNLGEVLASEAMAQFNESAGYGVMLGDCQDGAFILACLDAAQKAGNRKQQRDIYSWLKEFEPVFIKHLQEQRDMTKSTRVNFGLMVEG
ncbi:MAG: phosphonate C-P lyase system protein PhnG [Desulfonatronovibrio sp.]